MKNTQRQSASSPKKTRRFAKEKWIAVFGLLMVTALPALLATLGGLGQSNVRKACWDDRQIWMVRHPGEQAEQQPLSYILALSLAATNSSDTPMESLAAQAIALRSRGVWWVDYCPEGENAPQGEVYRLCDSPSHGLPYLSLEELCEMYGEQEALARMEAGECAVESTRGKVLCYNGEVIPALLHHSSHGNTRGAEQLEWVSVVSTPEEGNCTQLHYDAEELRLLIAASFGIEISLKPWEWSLELEKDEDGWVTKVNMGEKTVSGDAFAAALSIPSVRFDLQIEKDGLAVTAVGEGSGCGLSRAGASLYAVSGLTRWEILGHYFPDCTVEIMEE